MATCNELFMDKEEREQEMRDAYEAWAEPRGFDMSYVDDVGYTSPDTAVNWAVWQDAWKAASA